MLWMDCQHVTYHRNIYYPQFEDTVDTTTGCVVNIILDTMLGIGFALQDKHINFAKRGVF